MKKKLTRVARLEDAEPEEVMYPQFYEIKGAGSPHVNGIYLFHGICNDRPYYLKKDHITPALWYFQTKLFPSSYWCGWYISKSVYPLILFL
jgi:hypothetical protein